MSVIGRMVSFYLLALAAVLALGSLNAWSQPPSYIWSVVWSPDGKRLATTGGSDPGAAKVWDAETGKQLLSLSLRSGISSITWSPDGKRLATASQDNAVTVWDAETGKELLTLGTHGNFAAGGSVASVAWSPDGKRLATGTGRLPPSVGRDLRSPFDVAKVWDAGTGKELLTLSGQDNSVSSVAWSPDGKRLAARSGDRTAKVWDAETGKELLTLSGHNNSISSVAWSPDGKRLATGSDDKTMKVWDAETGKELLTLSGHNNSVSSVAWSPDGRRLATGSYDGKARLWDAEAGRELRTLSSHSGRVFSVAWSPDGTRLATGTDCNTVRVWDAETGKELLTLKGFFQGCESMSDSGGPAVTLGIELSLPDGSSFYVPAVGDGEMLGVISVSNGRFAGVRIIPAMGADSVKMSVSALFMTGEKFSQATCQEIRAWHSEGAGSYQGKEDESLSLSGLARLGLPVLKVKVVHAHGPPPGAFHNPYGGFVAYCECKSWLSPAKCSESDALGERATPCWFLSYPGAGKCVEFSGCGQCCRIVPP